MKIVPLDSQKKHILQCFLQLVYEFPGTPIIYKQLYEKIKSKGKFKLTTKSISTKTNRLFLDIYKRVCIKLLKKNPQSVYLSPEMEEKVFKVIRYYEQLNSKDIFIKICQRYFGNKQLGQVTQQQEIQFYQEINMKVKQKFQKKDLVDFEQEHDDRDEKLVKGKFVLFAKGKTQNDEEQTGQQEMKIEKNWKNKLQNDIKKLQGQNDKFAKFNKKEQSVTRTKIQKKLNNQQSRIPYTEDQQKGFKNNNEDEIKLQLKKQQILNRDQIIQQKSQFTTGDIKVGKQKEKKIEQDKGQKLQKKVTKRKINKVKGLKQKQSISVKESEQIWTGQLTENLCQQYLQKSDNLTELVSSFLANHSQLPIMSAEQISQQLIKIMLQSYDFYLNSHQDNPNQKYQISQLETYGRQQIQDLLKVSNCHQLRKKLVSLYLKMKKPDFKIKQKEGQQIFLHVKQEMTRLKIKQQKQIFDKNEFLDSLIGTNHSQKQLSQMINKQILMNRKKKTRIMINQVLNKKGAKRSLQKQYKKQSLKQKNQKKPRKMRKKQEKQ